MAQTGGNWDVERTPRRLGASARPGWTIPERARPVNQAVHRMHIAPIDCGMHLSQLLDDDLLTRGQGRFEMGLRDKELNVPEFPDGIPDPSNRSATAQYIGRMTGELRSLAQKADLPFLAYLLAMAEEDALSGSRKR